METILDLRSVKEILTKEAGVLVYFYNDDCPPCISLRPKVEELMNQFFPKIRAIWVNSKASPEVPAAFGVFAPAILLFFDGKETRRFSKYVALPELQASIDRYYRLVFDEPYEGSDQPYEGSEPS